MKREKIIHQAQHVKLVLKERSREDASETRHDSPHSLSTFYHYRRLNTELLNSIVPKFHLQIKKKKEEKYF